VKVTVSGSDSLRSLAAELASVTERAIPEGKKVVGQGCLQIKRDVQRRWSGMPHLPHLPRAIDYDVRARGDTIHGEVGANHSKLQGKLAWVPEYGTPTSAPNPAMGPAADAEEPRFVAAVERLGAKLLGDQ
jgi:hypothetical protein